MRRVVIIFMQAKVIRRFIMAVTTPSGRTIPLLIGLVPFTLSATGGFSAYLLRLG